VAHNGLGEAQMLRWPRKRPTSGHQPDNPFLSQIVTGFVFAVGVGIAATGFLALFPDIMGEKYKDVSGVIRFDVPDQRSSIALLIVGAPIAIVAALFFPTSSPNRLD
jgi:hypothetical protein